MDGTTWNEGFHGEIEWENLLKYTPRNFVLFISGFPFFQFTWSNTLFIIAVNLFVVFQGMQADNVLSANNEYLKTDVALAKSIIQLRKYGP